MGPIRPLEERVEVADNPEPRCPCLLLLDTSGSMKGERLAALTRGLFTFRAALAADPIAARRIEVAVVTFGSRVDVVQPFIAPDRFVPPALTGSGQTHMAEGIERALTLIASRKGFYKRQGLFYYRPWVFMITDGQPEGESETAVAHAAARLRRYEAEKRVAFFAVGVGGADMAALQKMVVRPPLPLRELAFDDLFLWLSASMQSVSRSQPGDKVELPRMSWIARVGASVREHEKVIENLSTMARIGLKFTLGV